MKPHISEFSYGFAVTEELIHDLPGLSAAPVFPSLYQEGQTGGGYDVMIEAGAALLFIQFKLCDFMVRSTAHESQEGILQVPFYRMHLRPGRHSDQHRLLLELEQSGQLVYYAAPMFYRVDEFNDAFLSRSTIERSIWVRPADIGDFPDDEDHHLAFRPDGDVYLCSKPSPIPGKVDSATMVAHLERAVHSNTRKRKTTMKQIKVVLETITRIAEDTESTPQPVGRQIANDERLQGMTTLERLAYYARGLFGSQLYLVHRSES